MKAIERAVAHFESQEVQVIEVPEWADDNDVPLKIYSKPLTLAEMSKLQRYASDNDVQLMAYCIIEKALDETGERMFTLEDKNSLMNKCDRNVIARIAGEIMSSSSLEITKKK